MAVEKWREMVEGQDTRSSSRACPWSHCANVPLQLNSVTGQDPNLQPALWQVNTYFPSLMTCASGSIRKDKDALIMQALSHHVRDDSLFPAFRQLHRPLTVITHAVFFHVPPSLSPVLSPKSVRITIWPLLSRYGVRDPLEWLSQEKGVYTLNVPTTPAMPTHCQGPFQKAGIISHFRYFPKKKFPFAR